MTTLKEWKENRPNYSLLETLAFTHTSFPNGYQVIKDAFSDVVIAGQTYKPSSFTVSEPEQDGTASISMTITFLMGAEDVRTIMKSWKGPLRMSPISCTYCMWASSKDSSPILTRTLYVKDVSSDATNVLVTLSLTNPLTLGTDKTYRVSEYPGLRTS